MTIGERVRARRKELNLTADDVAEALGKNRATIFRYESNEIEKLPTTVLEPLARILRTTPAYLMGWEDLDNETIKKNDIIADIVLRLRSDDEFRDIVTDLYNASTEQLNVVKAVSSAFKKH